MRIGIEAQRIFRKHKHGMERVAIELIKHLQEIDTQNEYYIFVKSDVDSKVISSTNNFNIIEIPSCSYLIWEQIQLPKYVKKYKCDILHCTSSTAPLFLKTPIITTIHDIIFMERKIISQIINNASLLQKVGNIYRRIIIPFVIKKGNYFITVSHYEKNKINNHFNLKNKKFKVIYNGVSNIFNNKLDEKIDHTNILNINSKYFLHIANRDPRKNTKRVLLAFNKYKNQTKNKELLVIIGLSQKELSKVLKKLNLINLSKKIVHIKYVTDKDLAKLYKSAEIFLFPSLREGFGLPVLEAMASGVPLISSNSSSIPEIVNNSALLIDPYNIDEIYHGIVSIQENLNYKKLLIEKGIKRSKQFSWKTMSVETHKLYQEVILKTLEK